MERIDLEAALELLLARTIPIEEILRLPLIKARGLVTGKTILAPLDNPPFDRAPLDGFAFRSEDTAGASEANPARLHIAGVVYAGSVHDAPLLPGEALRIMTGAPMPAGSDAMLPKEDVSEKEKAVLVFRPVKKHENYIFRGEDIRKGQLLIREGEGLDFIRLGLLAGLGLAEVPVFRPPEIGILCTGDELVPPGAPLPPGKIYNNNGILLSTRLEELGFHPRLLPVAADEPETAAAEIRAHMEDLDLLISTGGVSVGDRDIMRDVFTLLGAEQLFWRMTFKPGSAILCGVYRKKLLICLSGNPFAAMANLELLVRPVLAKLAQRPDLETRRLRARLISPFPKQSGTRRFIRARLEPKRGDEEFPLISLPEGHSSGHMLSLLSCNCFVDIPAGSAALPAGSVVNVVLFGSTELL
ncbi:gephyrin-like molybdotransferase Glp [Treponema primitia]|uniref:molybdopterin molybdotransferase MoeA n=1 Tax=Treponema primitia TaxID=88058 RepID=UPI000255562E|nr:gephyrin-like molybdotransferase Glp [Treponema primitia]